MTVIEDNEALQRLSKALFCPLAAGTLAERFALWCKKFSNKLKK